MKICFLFPGQGAQYPGMGKDLWEESRKVKDLFELASDSTGIDVKKLIFEGTEDELKATDKTQVAITLINLSAGALLKERGIKPGGVAGFSLGEYSALYEAGVISLDSIFPIVKARGDLMEKASRNLDSPKGNPGMAAIIGLPFERVIEVLSHLDNVFAANDNSPTQVVVSGTFDGLQAAEPVFKEAGARRFIQLKVSGPFHCPLLEEAKKGLEEVLAGYHFADPSIAVYANATGNRVKSGNEAKDLCIRQVVSTVQWVDEERCLLDDGFDCYYEVGPGSVLTGLWKSFSQEYACTPVGKLEAISQIKEG
ncbi:MAG TPA: ACP S-malonyltransferase [Spirochaetia bacterium]|nr:ACP S-malonyltransferase [Spirochaetia bacterium]